MPPSIAQGPTHVLPVGTVISERYRIDAVLGEGGMGVVYRAEHLHLRKPFALKVLLPLWSSLPEVVARFEREAVAAGRIESPHVAAATDFGRLDDGAFFLVMEFLDGRTLRTSLSGTPVPRARAIHVARGAARALHAAHACGIVHRDLKPENIMLVERDGDPDFVKVLDFGIAKVEGGAGGVLTQLGTVIGTPHYMSPEQATGQPVDARSDLYSLGVILFELLTGHCPFDGEPLAVLRMHVEADVPPMPDAVDPRLAAICLRLLAKAPENRFATAAELVVALEELGTPTLRPPPSRSSRPGSMPAATDAAAQRRASRRPVALVAAGAVLVGALGTTAAVALSGGQDERQSPAAAASTVALEAGAAAAFAPGPSATWTTAVPPVLPPPPAPSGASAAAATATGATSARPAASQGQARRTGPGGIYIPPPSQWFK